MYPPNLKSVALPVPEIIGDIQKWTVPGYTNAPFSPKFLMGFDDDRAMCGALYMGAMKFFGTP